MDAVKLHLIQAIHDAPPLVALVLTGGGTDAAAQLLAVPGASRTVLEVVVPYDEHALCEYLGRRPQQACSAETAMVMAERAFSRAQHLAPGKPVIGLGCTASLVTDRPKRGDHRFFVATVNEQGTTISSLILEKGARTREQEESVVDTVILNELAQAMGLAERLPLAPRPGEQLQTQTIPNAGSLPALTEGRQALVCQDVDGRLPTDSPRPRLVLPGAFNPLHEAHRQLARVAARLTGETPAFELCILNVDKPPLTLEEIRRRLHQFAWLSPVWLTRAPLFTEKSNLFPGATFVVGVDTASRIVEPRYYGSDAQMETSLEHIRAQGCRFLVAGRRTAEGRFLQLPDLAIPPKFQNLFAAIPETEFHIDLSSTELRAKGEGPS